MAVACATQEMSKKAGTSCEDVDVDLDVVGGRRPERRRRRRLHLDVVRGLLVRILAEESRRGPRRGRRWAQRPRPRPAQRQPSRSRPRSTSTEDAPTEDAPTEDAPTEDAPTEDAPTEDAPTEDAPTEDAPTEDAPTEDAPEAGPNLVQHLWGYPEPKRRRARPVTRARRSRLNGDVDLDSTLDLVRGPSNAN